MIAAVAVTPQQEIVQAVHIQEVTVVIIQEGEHIHPLGHINFVPLHEVNSVALLLLLQDLPLLLHMGVEWTHLVVTLEDLLHHMAMIGSMVHMKVAIQHLTKSTDTVLTLHLLDSILLKMLLMVILLITGHHNLWNNVHVHILM